MENEEKSLGISLISTIGSSETTDILKDTGEIVLDSFIADGLLKDIPIINSVVALSKTAISISNYLFIKKVFSFLQNLDSFPELEKQEEWKKIEEDRKYANKIGETIILLLDRFDSLEKPELLAKVFSSFIKGEIDHSTFMRISTAIDRASISDLRALLYLHSTKDFWSDSEIETICKSLVHSGFSEIIYDMESLESFIVEKAREHFRILKSETHVGFVSPFPNNTYRYELSKDAFTFMRIILKDKYKTITVSGTIGHSYRGV